MLGLDENKKIGIGLIFGGSTCFALAILLFFDRALLIIGNLCFLAGLMFLVGVVGTYGFFMKKGKFKGTLVYFLGFFIIVMLRWSLVGFVTQLVGLFLLFRTFIPFLYEWSFNIPVIGSCLRNSQFCRKLVDMSAKKKKPQVQGRRIICFNRTILEQATQTHMQLVFFNFDVHFFILSLS
eukprot:TRINITY_DN5206_c0_g1_i12.p3 TRINITY_DN5206_c0_g1~~TRINITY_DN5206_c0_g1_i12.p3  ORF type:complete len:180 (+),score=44.95 TRINITY_DN5206_c0_g1_i12:276-815(+)